MREGNCARLVIQFRLAEIGDHDHVEKLTAFHQRLKALSGHWNLCRIGGQVYEFLAVLDVPLCGASEKAQALQALFRTIIEVLDHASRCKPLSASGHRAERSAEGRSREARLGRAREEAGMPLSTL
jgi:hypothetical protein